MNIKDLIVKVAQKYKTFTVNDVLRKSKRRYSRAYILTFIKQLLVEKRLVKSGSTRGARYADQKNAEYLETQSKKRYTNKELKEHEVLEEFQKKCPFFFKLPENIQSIFEYAFTEMVNNAIDHSQSKNIDVHVEKQGKIIRFTVDDVGIGVFKSVMSKRKLNSELEAIQDLLKGKTTTQPHAHSGEGIFFTSKTADTFILNSFDYQLKIDNTIKDIFITELKPRKRGTRVLFEISEDHKGHLNDVFKRYYTNLEELAFDKTEIQIRLYTMGSIYISRSQARRVLAGLEKFKSIILDFDKVPGVGQAFADEVFRVFKGKNQDIKITPINMNEAVAFMIKRVEPPLSTK